MLSRSTLSLSVLPSSRVWHARLLSSVSGAVRNTAATAPANYFNARSLSERRRDHCLEALRLVRAGASPRFVDSVNISVRLNVDTKRSDERVRGSVLLPHSTGKSVRVAVFARGELADRARAAGADVVGAEELVEEVLNGNINFERCFATPDTMPILAKAARTLGPKGLMPNPKRGSVITDVEDTIHRAKGGEIIFKADKEAIASNMIGKLSSSSDVLCDNIMAYVQAVLDCRPARFKTKPPLSIALSTTHGLGIRLNHKLWITERQR